MSIDRKLEETLEEYAMRLYRQQEMLGLSNQEVADLLNIDSGENFDESTYRKKYKLGVQYYDKGFDDGYMQGIEENDDVTSSVILDELFEERAKNFKIKKQMQDKLREYRKLLTSEARTENLLGVIKESVYSIEQEYPILNNQKSNFQKPVSENKTSVLLLSDWHYGEVVNDFLNTYNHDVFMQRVSQLTKDVIDYNLLMGVKTLKVLNLGDLISGDIHVTTRVNNEEDLITQLIIVCEVLAQMIDKWSKYFDIEFYTVTDNHSRTTKYKKDNIERENYQLFIPFWLKERFRKCDSVQICDNIIDNTIDFEIGSLDILGEVALFTHGHNDNIKNIATQIPLMTQKIPIALFVGHFHHNFEGEENRIDIIGNPSLIGTGEYAKGLRKTSLPRQKMVIYEKRKKQVSRVCTFFCRII